MENETEIINWEQLFLYLRHGIVSAIKTEEFVGDMIMVLE